MSIRRGNQDEYNRMLDDFNGKSKKFIECVNYLVGQGFSISQANNAVHVYHKGGATRAIHRLSHENRNQLLDGFDAFRKKNKECVDYLRRLGYTYRQATTAAHRYRQEKGLIGK